MFVQCQILFIVTSFFYEFMRIDIEYDRREKHAAKGISPENVFVFIESTLLF